MAVPLVMGGERVSQLWRLVDSKFPGYENLFLLDVQLSQTLSASGKKASRMKPKFDFSDENLINVQGYWFGASLH